MSSASQIPESTDEYLDLRQYVSILKYRKWQIIAIITLIVASALAYSYSQTPLYTSEASVLVKSPTAGTLEAGEAPNLETERRLASSETVAALVADDIGGDPEDILKGLSVQAQSNTEILGFVYTDPSPVRAQRHAQSFADAYLEFRRQQTLDDLLAVSDSVQQRIQQLNRQLSDTTEALSSTNDNSERATLQAQANALVGQIAILQQELVDLTPPDTLRVGQVVSPASLPEAPSSPNHLTNALLGLILGLGLGIGWALLRERLDDRLRGKEDLEVSVRTAALAAIPQVSGWKKKQAVLVSVSDGKSAAAEAYRTLRTGILFSMNQSKARTLMVTSAHPGEGKTTTAANLGVVLAQADRRVVLVSADLRRPHIHNYFGIDNQTGLTHVLAQEISPWQALKDSGVENLQILNAGAIPGNPAELLGSGAMADLLGQLADKADVVIIDAAPVLAVSDSLALARLVDGVLFVANADKTHRAAVQQARRQLDQVDAKLIGSVLNNLAMGRAHAYGYYGYGSYYHDENPPRKESESGTRLLRRVSGK